VVLRTGRTYDPLGPRNQPIQMRPRDHGRHIVDHGIILGRRIERERGNVIENVGIDLLRILRVEHDHGVILNHRCLMNDLLEDGRMDMFISRDRNCMIRRMRGRVQVAVPKEDYIQLIKSIYSMSLVLMEVSLPFFQDFVNFSIPSRWTI